MLNRFIKAKETGNGCNTSWREKIIFVKLTVTLLLALFCCIAINNSYIITLF